MNRLLFVILIVLAVISSADRTGGASARLDSITGLVLVDGQPLANAVVYARAVGAQKSEYRTVLTNEDGKFQITDLHPGAYKIKASASGYVDSTDNSADSEPSYYRPGDNVNITMIKGGVITGSVMSSSGEPVVVISVRAIRVRDVNGRSVRTPEERSEQITDDRGIYRFYGLQPGSYLIATDNNRHLYFPLNIYESDVPTYYPSATRNTATEVTVQSGEEVTGINIRYRGEQGRAISGTISGATGSNNLFRSILITLTHASTYQLEATTYISLRGSDRKFTFRGVSDGEYNLTAQVGIGDEDSAASTPRRVVVKGADVTGVELALIPLGSISGRVLFEAQKVPTKVDCASKQTRSIDEVVVIARRDEKQDGKDLPVSRLPSTVDGVPNNRGAFLLRDLKTGRYRMEARLPSEDWYIRAITLPGVAQSRQSTSVASNGLSLKLGDRISNLTITIAQGAAGLRGRVVPEEGERLPSRLRVHLVPFERENINDALRFAEATVSNGAFAFSNIAPGRYWLIARSVADGEDIRPVAWDSEGRALLRREAETANIRVDLSPCQQMADFNLHYRTK